MASFFFGGLCGMGMAPLAAFLSEDNNRVLGFDDVEHKETKTYLEKFGVKFVDKNTSLKQFDKVVLSTALKKNTHQFLKNGANAVQFRGECWADICKKRRLAAIVGSHGKSTVSALVAHAIKKYNLKSGWLVGAIPNDFEMHRYCAEGEKIISEIDESDGTIENFSPEITVALNADLDHTDTYADWQALKEMFYRLFSRTKKYILFPETDTILSEIASNFPQKAIPVKTSENFVETNIAIAKKLVEVFLECEVDNDTFSDYKGLRRRQEILAKTPAFTAIADYAHHPNEVKTFLQYFDKNFSDKKKIIVFQPHRYTRTKQFATNFAEIFDFYAQKNCKIIVAPVYPASEPFDALGTSEKIAEKSKKMSIVLAKTEEIFKIIEASILNDEKPAIAIVGAGDIYFEVKEFFKENKWQK